MPSLTKLASPSSTPPLPHPQQHPHSQHPGKHRNSRWARVTRTSWGWGATTAMQRFQPVQGAATALMQTQTTAGEGHGPAGPAMHITNTRPNPCLCFTQRGQRGVEGSRGSSQTQGLWRHKQQAQHSTAQRTGRLHRGVCGAGGGVSGVSLGVARISTARSPWHHYHIQQQQQQQHRQQQQQLNHIRPACLTRCCYLPCGWSVQVAGRPAFLDPEATRPLATSRTHGLAGGVGGAAAPGQQGKGKKGRLPAEGEFDISRLAPPVKGQQQ